MTSGPYDSPIDEFDPGSMPSTSLSIQRAVWFRRPWFLVTVGLIVVVTISIITDLPHHVSRAEDTSQQNGVIKLINVDTKPCVFALKESFSFYREEFTHTLDPSNLATVKNYLLQDQTACSFASGPIYDMVNNITVIDTAPGKKVDAALASTVKWITYDAVGAIVNIRNYFASGANLTVTTKLGEFQDLLNTDRAGEVAYVQSASELLSTTLTPINLPALPRLAGT